MFGEGEGGLQTNPKNPNLFANVQHSEGGGGAMSQVPKTSILMLIIPPSTCSMQEKIGGGGCPGPDVTCLMMRCIDKSGDRF